MKFLFRGHWGEIVPLAHRVQSEGNQVQLYVGDKNAKSVGDGLVRKAVDLGRAIDWADCIVYESNVKDLPSEAEKVRLVRPVVGSSALAGKLENDRSFAKEFAQKAGLPVSGAWKAFRGGGAWTGARRWLANQADPATGWVFKPNGDAPVSTYVSDDTEEIERMLAYWEALYRSHNKEPDFVLTPKVECQAEVSTEGWWDGEHMALLNHTIERNRLLPGEIGEKVGCVGNVVWLAPDSKLATMLMANIGQQLGVAYRGPIDINVIIEEESNEPLFLEFTPRFGYDAIFGLVEFVDDFGKLLSDTARGQLVGAEMTHDSDGQFAGAYRITVPPYPEDPSKKDEVKAVGVPVFGFDKKYSRHVHPIEVRLSDQEDLETSGPTGYVAVFSAMGATPAEAMDKAYKVGKPVKVPLMHYRNDLAEAIGNEYDALEATGWIEPVEPEEPQSVSIFGRTVHGR